MPKTILIEAPSRLYLGLDRKQCVELPVGTKAKTTDSGKDGLFLLHVKVEGGAYDGQQGFLPDYERFNGETFERDFIPSSGVGSFHIAFVPSSRKLEIHIDLSLHYNGEFFPHYFKDYGGSRPNDWDSMVKTVFKGTTPKISEIWNEKFEFRCGLGGEAVSVRPTFKLKTE
jgi:hypothetical protein